MAELSFIKMLKKHIFIFRSNILRRLTAMYGALYGIIRYLFFEKEANKATGNQTISSTHEAGKYI